MSAQVTGGLDRKQKIEEYVCKNVPELRDEVGDWSQDRREASLGITSHSTTSTLRSLVPSKEMGARPVVYPRNLTVLVWKPPSEEFIKKHKGTYLPASQREEAPPLVGNVESSPGLVAKDSETEAAVTERHGGMLCT